MSRACFSGNGSGAIGGPRLSSASFAAYSVGDMSFASLISVIVLSLLSSAHEIDENPPCPPNLVVNRPNQCAGGSIADVIAAAWTMVHLVFADR
jgi:hypothetical protein